MSKIHVLSADTTGNYKVVIHTPTPAGNNSAGFTWISVGLASGILGTTILTVGTNPGQITSVENSAIIAGTTLEIVTTIPAESGAATTASLNQMVDQIINQTLSDLNKKLKYFGYTQ